MSTPMVTATRTHHAQQFNANGDIAGGPDLRDINDRPFRVDHIYALWTRTGDGAWWLDWVKLSGPRILKSGTTSGTRLGLHLSGIPNQRPGWVNDWLNRYEPKLTPQP